jgi:NDP-sugar pyrophosphorylase family protein
VRPDAEDVKVADLPVAILAGGLATRLRPITEKIPKALVRVAGEPFLTHQLALLRSRGIRDVVLCVGYLGEMIEREFGNGSAFGVQIKYSYDGDRLLGTGGALRKALPLLGAQFFVLYGDSYLPVDFRDVATTFQASGEPALMTVFKNADRWDASNVVFEGGAIRVYDKKNRLPEMRHIDYGLGVIHADVLERWPAAQHFDLAEVYHSLAAEGRLAGHEVTQRFYEIGSPAGLAELEEFLLSNGRVSVS